MNTYTVTAKEDLVIKDYPYEWKKGVSYTVTIENNRCKLETEKEPIVYKTMYPPQQTMNFFDIESISAYAFESLERPGMYITDGPDVPSMDSHGETNQIEDALLVLNQTFMVPSKEQMDEYYKFMKVVTIFDYEEFKKLSKPVEVKLTNEQLRIIRERNEW